MSIDGINLIDMKTNFNEVILSEFLKKTDFEKE